MQVELYAQYEPQRLMGFLITSQSYGLEAAHHLCKSRGLVREQVFVLGRMGNAHEALHLIIQHLADIPQAPPPPRGNVVTLFISDPHSGLSAPPCLVADVS